MKGKRARWRLVLILLITVILLGDIIAPASLAQSTSWVHGRVQDEQYQPVNGGTIWLEQEHQNQWYEYGNSRTVMPSQWFGWDVRQAGNYRIIWKLDGYVGPDPSELEFTVPGAPIGDIVVNVKHIPIVTVTPTRIPVATVTPTRFPIPTTLMPPTVDPTSTPTPTAAPCLEFQQFTWLQRRAVIDNAVLAHNRQLEDRLDWDNDLTLVFGLRDQLLGMPGSRRFEITVGGETLTARAFSNGILTMRPIAREECMSYGVITWDGTQNWMAQ